jgi:hypothetical protein
MCAFWMLCNCKSGVSSCEVARALGITQKSAWFMLHRIRKAMESEGGQLAGTIEMDETVVGGNTKNMHKSKKPKGTGFSGIAGGAMAKTIVVGMLERGGRVKAQVVIDRTREVLDALADQHIAEGSTLVTDEWHPYKGSNFQHEIINDVEAYVRGRVHTNGIENFWSLLNRGLGGTYISVEPFHLFRYIDEQAFPYNNRKGKNDQARFEAAMRNVFGKRLTYSELTVAGSATPQ